MRILIMGSFQYTSHFRCMLTLCEALANKGNNIFVLAPSLPANLQKEAREKFSLVSINDTPELSKIDLVHFHLWDENTSFLEHCKQNSISYMVSLYFLPRPPQAQKIMSLLFNAAAVTTPNHQIFQQLKRNLPEILLIPEGIDLENPEYSTTNKIKIAYIANEVSYSHAAYKAVVKAVTSSGLTLETLNFEKPLSTYENFYGWPLKINEILNSTDIIIASGMALIEGMACYNAALIMDTQYRGIFDPKNFPANHIYNKPKKTGKSPCYKDVFYDISALAKNKPRRTYLQEQGYDYARKNHDLKKILPAILRIYHSIV